MSHNKTYANKKRVVGVLHHIVLFAMLHSTFVAPAQGIIYAYIHKKEKNIHKGSYYKWEESEEINSNILQNSLSSKTLSNSVQKVNTGHKKVSGGNVNSRMVFSADIKEGVIGMSKENPVDSPQDNLFKIQIDQLPEANTKVYLSYKLYGLTDHLSVARSINERQSLGGHIIKKQLGWSQQKEEIDGKWLKEGENSILFTIPKQAGYYYKIKDLTIEIEKTNEIQQQLVLPGNVTTLVKDNKLYIKGFLRSNDKSAKVYAGSEELKITNAEFEGFISITEEIKKNKFIPVKAVSTQGFLGQELLFIDNILEADQKFAIDEKDFTKTIECKSFTSNELSLEGASLTINDSALNTDKILSVTKLRHIDIAPLGSGVINVTKGASAYRFLPDGIRFNKAVNISISYDAKLLPTGYSPKDIKTYYFDTSSKSWRAIEVDSVDAKKQVIFSKTTHFTDYINGVIQAPDSPETNAFMPTMMSDVKAADPSAEITLISPPEASQKGDANVSYPIKIPAGRRGMQPQIGLQYSNNGGNSWVGNGWSLNTPAISIDTRWGTPIFDPEEETELYSLNGEQLMYPNGYMPHRHQDVTGGVYSTEPQYRFDELTGNAKIFIPRKQGSFAKIERLGGAPEEYYWKVTDTDGTISWYGGDRSGLMDNAVIKDAQGRVVHWGLCSVQDIYGNTMRYLYDNTVIPTPTGANANLENGQVFYLEEIWYTGDLRESGHYSVKFIKDTNIRKDATVSGRLGIKQVDPYLLKYIDVSYKEDLIRRYTLNHDQELSRLGKTRLLSVTEASPNDEDHYTHTFEYYDDLTENGTVTYFDPETEVSICAEDEPCVDSDGDGICDIEDNCPTVAGLILYHGCPEAPGQCYTVTFPIPQTYRYSYTSKSLEHYLPTSATTECIFHPTGVYSVTFGTSGNMVTNTAGISLTHAVSGPNNTVVMQNLCPATVPIDSYSFAVQSPLFGNKATSVFNNIFAGKDITVQTITNQSYLYHGLTDVSYAPPGTSSTTNWYERDFFSIVFYASRPDYSLNTYISETDADPGTYVVDIPAWASDYADENLNVSNSSQPLQLSVSINGQRLGNYAARYYLTAGQNSAFVTALQNAYPGAQVSVAGNNVTITIPNAQTIMSTIAVSGQTYPFVHCASPSSSLPRFSNNSLSYNYFSTVGNDFTIGLTSSSSSGNPDCPTFRNQDFLIQGTIPSYQSAGAALGSAKSTSYNAGARVGIGIGWNTFSNMTTFGLGMDFGWDKSESLTQLIDLDGDGLEDIVWSNGSTIFYKKHAINVTYDQDNRVQVNHSFGSVHTIQGMDKFYRQEGTSRSTNFSISAGLFGVSAFAGLNTARSNSEADIFFTDGNGDGLPDIVRYGRVYFNRLDANGIPFFEADSKLTENMVITAAPKEIEIVDEEEIEYPKQDVVKVWEAPADGNIKIINDIELTDTNKESMVTVEMKNDDSPACYYTSFFAPTTTINITGYLMMGGRTFFAPGLYINSQNPVYPNISGQCTFFSNRFKHLILNNTIYDSSIMNASPNKLFIIHGNEFVGALNQCPSDLTVLPPFYTYDYSNYYDDSLFDTSMRSLNSSVNIPAWISTILNTSNIPYSGLSYENKAAAFLAPYPGAFDFEMQFTQRLDQLIYFISTANLTGTLKGEFSFDGTNWSDSPGFVLESEMSGTLLSTGLAGVSVNCYIDGILLPGGPFNLINNFGAFQQALQLNYPTVQVLQPIGNQEYRLKILSNDVLNTISFVSVSNPNQSATYNFTISQNCESLFPREINYEYVNPFQNAKVTKESEILALKRWEASDEIMNTSFISSPLEMVFDFNNNNNNNNNNNKNYRSLKSLYIFKKYEDHSTWYDNKNEIINDQKQIEQLNEMLPLDIEVQYNAYQKGLKELERKIRLQNKEKAIKELQQIEHEQAQQRTANPEPSTPTTCPQPGELCQLFGAQLNAGNASVNNTITNYSTSCNPHQSSLYVKKGDKIYFRVHSIDNGNPAVNWNPRVEYTNAAIVNETDENGLDLYKTSYSDGFILADSSGEVVFPGTGTASISWPDIQLSHNPSDEITYEIFKRVYQSSDNDSNSHQAYTETPIFRKVCPANQNVLVTEGSNQISGIDLGQIEATANSTGGYTTFYFKVSATSNVNWKECEWKPVMVCNTDQNIIAENGNTIEGSVETNENKYPIPDYSIYKMYACSQPYSRYTPLMTGSCNIQPYLSNIFSGTDNGSLYFVVKKNGDLVGKKQITVTNGSVSYGTGDITTNITAGNKIEIGYYIDDTALNIGQESLLGKIAQATAKVATVTFTSNNQVYDLYKQNVNLYHKVAPQFGPMYRQWGQFMYVPENVTGPTTPLSGGLQGSLIKEEALEITQQRGERINEAVNEINDMNLDQADLDNPSNTVEQDLLDFQNEYSDVINVPFITARPQRDYVNGGVVERWVGSHFESYASASSYRAELLNRVFDGIEEPETEITQDVLQTGAYAISRFSRGQSKNISAGGGFGQVNVSGSKSLDGESISITDYVDLNGDRYPDLISHSNVQFTRRTGGLYNTSQITSPFEGNIGETGSSSWGISASGSFYMGKKNGGSEGADQQSSTAPVGTPAETAGTNIKKAKFNLFNGGVSAGISGEFSSGRDEGTKLWADINGDGLADRLEKSGNNIFVKMSYGNNNQFNTNEYDQPNQESLWQGFEINKGSSTAYGAGLGLGTSINNASIQGGYTLGKSLSHTENTLIDINSDGLPDIVTSDNNGLYVRLNDGNSFEPQVTWSDFNLKRANNTTTSSINVGFTYSYIFPLYLFFTVIPIKIVSASASVSRSTSTSNTQKTISDFDGDGYPDLLEEISPGRVKVHPSRIRRTDMLKAVYNPLGGRFTVNYDVVRPTYDNPHAKWVMTDVVVEDGYDMEGDGVDVYRKKYEYINARYDRREREFYGFETVKTIDRLEVDGQPGDVYRTNISLYHNESYFLNGLLKEAYMMKGSDEDALYSKTLNTYKLRPLNTSTGLLETGFLPSNFDTGGQEGRKGAAVVLTATDTYLYEFDSTNPLFTQSFMDYDSYGRVIKYINFGAEITEDDYSTQITYHDEPGLNENHIINVPKSIVVTPLNSSAILRKRTTTVDTYTGDVLSINVYMGAGQDELITTMEYDSYGNLKKVTYPANLSGQSMYYDYKYDDVEHKYIKAIADAYGQSSISEYDYRFDKILSTKDMASNISQYEYDSFGRLRYIIGPKESELAIPYTIKFEYYPTLNEVYNLACFDSIYHDRFMPLAITKHYDPDHPGNDIETITFSDGLARPVQVKKDIEMNAGLPEKPDMQERMSVSGIVFYDEFGRASEQRNPWYEEKNCEVNILFNEYQTQHFSKTQYDVADRPTSSMDQEGNISENIYTIQNDFYGNLAASVRSVVEQNNNNKIITEVFKDITGKVTSTKNILESSTGTTNIWTRFTYTTIGEIKTYTDNEGLVTKYIYDLAGRKKGIDHPDNGRTTYYYDLASNLVKLQTANLAANLNLLPEDRFIKYEYDFNRLKKIKYPPVNGNDNIANVVYEYGVPGSGNTTGRLIYQKDATGEQHFEYGNMGEMIYNKRTIVGPNIPTRTFETMFEYDSWNRVKMIIYPDREKVRYSYDLGGNLNTIEGTRNSDNYLYVQRMEYDYYEQRTYLLYGNGTDTYYEYTPEMRRLKNLNVLTATGESIIKNQYSYDRVGNITWQYNSASPTTYNNMGGDFENIYTYDNLNRLIHAEGHFSGDISQHENNNDFNSTYEVGMEYNTTHGIEVKNQEHHKNGGSIVNQNTYKNAYKYIENSHKVLSIENGGTVTDEFKYDANGNMVTHYNLQQPRSLYWDESNRLRVVAGNDMQHYIYDAGGERVLKASAASAALYENGSLVNNTVAFDAYTTYPSAFIVVDPQGKYSKHYYAGSQRIVSAIGEMTADIFLDEQQPVEPRTANPAPKEGNSFNADQLRQLQIADLAAMLAKDNKGVPGFKKYKPENEDADEPNTATVKEDNTAQRAPEPGNIYFYHPDHLGTSTYLTDANGQPYQFFINLPFGETMAEQHSLTEDYETPYKFNGKELDAETGFYYYGARYYNPRVSIWLSTDPLMEKYPGVNPYVYCNQNPINLIDPDGMEPTPFPKALLGSVDYYKWRHRDFIKQNPGKKAPDYYLNYGNKYIQRFTNETNNQLSKQGKQWLKNARKNLQVAIEDKLKVDPTIELRNGGKDFKEFAFDSHVDAYWNAGLYKLNTVDLVAVVLTPNFKDLTSKEGLEQATEMMGKLSEYWLDNPGEGLKRGGELIMNRKKIEAMVKAKALREGIDPDKAIPIIDKILDKIPTIKTN
ncbi:hypothetical protein GR160_14030 [Flavobacterium sp. Sd200]|uniref:RHS repeat-associated core domain-containing protein n=1 Tax=Flavobacterium sp. Sd200 TaxID=2692211 RepID=UPI0013693D86|nr:SpvB/TcaC N-terminal domain-containing protein [Flavobacterium sp. Sd200]MXN92343.1 hypothetical protein [Flavobacterium sp. Sd200]